MSIRKSDRNILYLSLPLAGLVSLVSVVGIWTPDFYTRETLNWQAQAIGQDIANLFLVVPVLLIATLFSYKGHRGALLVWAGTVIYLLYTFLIYAFGVHFNMLFLIYCITLGLSFYTVLFFMYGQSKTLLVPSIINPTLIKFAGIYFIVLAVLFCLLWLSEIIPAILQETIPESVTEVGLPTNAVHVIDLSVFLPGMFIVGLLLLKKRPLGYLLAPVLLTFFVLMDITIGALMLIMKQRGLEANLSIAAVMGVLALLSLMILIFHLRQFRVYTKT